MTDQNDASAASTNARLSDTYCTDRFLSGDDRKEIHCVTCVFSDQQLAHCLTKKGATTDSLLTSVGKLN